MRGRTRARGSGPRASRPSARTPDRSAGCAIAQGSWVAPLPGSSPVRGESDRALSLWTTRARSPMPGRMAGAVDGIGGRTASTAVDSPGGRARSASGRCRPARAPPGLVQVAVGVPPKGAIHRRSTRGWERRPMAVRRAPERLWMPRRPSRRLPCSAGSFAGFGSAEAGGWLWIEFAYTPETEVHCEPTGPCRRSCPRRRGRSSWTRSRPTAWRSRRRGVGDGPSHVRHGALPVAWAAGLPGAGLRRSWSSATARR